MQRKSFGAEFEAKVTLKIPAGAKPINETAGANGVLPDRANP
jgi:hypothetical protein